MIKTPDLTRELSIELAGIGGFISDQLKDRPGIEPFTEELKEYKKSSTKLKLHNIFVIYNNFEGLLLEKEESRIERIRRELRLNFPYLSSQDQMTPYFLPTDRQQCVISCFFLSEVISKTMDIYGQSQRLKVLFDLVQGYYATCKSPSTEQHTPLPDELLSMPNGLFQILSSSLGENWILNLYQLTFEKLRTHYSNLTSFVHLQGSLKEIFVAY